MMSDYDDYFFEPDYYTDSELGWVDYDDEFDDFLGNGILSDSTDYMDYESHQPSKSLTELQIIYRDLDIPNPDHLPKNPLPLIDICAKKVALSFPFAYIEGQDPPVAENAQLKIIQYSFPQEMEKIKRYCTLNNGSSSEFDKAIKSLKFVKDLSQIGFHLSARVHFRGHLEHWHDAPPEKKSPYLYVSIKFDRGKITETNCPCENGSWCFHVIAVCLVRIFQQDKCKISPPLSDSLNNLSTYTELRTFTQYLIAEFNDQQIIESAQNVLDRMVKPQEHEDDAIHETWGAPDPTAGPGYDGQCQWLICEEGLTSRCKTLIQMCEVTKYCLGSNVTKLDEFPNSIWDWWPPAHTQQSFVNDYFTNLSSMSIDHHHMFVYNHQWKRTYSHEKMEEITEFLKTCEDLIYDDFEYSLKAVQIFTVQLKESMTEMNQRYTYTASNEKKYEANLFFGSIPRPDSCWLITEQVSRLWRLLLLNPCISVKRQNEIFTAMNNTKVIFGKIFLSRNSHQWTLWCSFEHIKIFKDFSWNNFNNHAMKTDNQSEMNIIKSNGLASSPGRDVDYFPIPSQVKYGDFTSSVTIHCCILEALLSYKKKEQAVFLAMNLSLVLVQYYTKWLEGERPEVQGILYFDDVSCKVHDDSDMLEETGNKGKRSKKKRFNRKRGRKANVKKSEDYSDPRNEKLFEIVEGVVPVSCFAYLIHVLDSNHDLLNDMLKQKKLKGLGLSEDDLMECDDATSDATSLIIRLAAIGLAFPRVHAASIHIQVDCFNWELYMSKKLGENQPSQADINFLKMFVNRMMNLTEYGFQPPYALIMNFFRHSYKFDGDSDSIGFAMRAISGPLHVANNLSTRKRFCLECERRHWVKLCEVVFLSVSENSYLVNQLLECMYSAEIMAGIGPEDKRVNFVDKRGKKDMKEAKRHGKNVAESMLCEKFFANIYLAHVITHYAESLREEEEKSEETKSLASRKLPHPNTFDETAVRSEKTKERKLNEQEQRLYEFALIIACRAFAVKNYLYYQHNISYGYHDFSYSFMEFMDRSLKWMCSLNKKIGALAFELILERHNFHSTSFVKCFNPTELLKICTFMMESEQKSKESIWIRTKDTLLSIMSSKSDCKITEIIHLCRTVEKEAPSKQMLLIPAVCKQLLALIGRNSIKAPMKKEHLHKVLVTMYNFCKKIESDDDSSETLECIKELFGENGSDEPSTSKETGNENNLEPNLQLCLDVAFEIVKYSSDTRTRNYESRGIFEGICEVVTYVARRAHAMSGKQSADILHNPDVNTKPFEMVHVNRFIETLCLHLKDYTLLADFFFELCYRLFGLTMNGSFGRHRVSVKDDAEVDKITKSSACFSVLLKRCINGLRAQTENNEMTRFIKETVHEGEGYCRTRARNANFYYETSLVTFLEVLKRLMNIGNNGEEFETFSSKLAARHPITRFAIDEIKNKGSNEEKQRHHQLVSSLLLQRMFNDTVSFGYEDDLWYD